jgi:hypothetical protein
MAGRPTGHVDSRLSAIYPREISNPPDLSPTRISHQTCGCEYGRRDRSTLVPIGLNPRRFFADFRLSEGKMIEGQFVEFLAIATVFYLLVLVIR